jgi:hypothetical protein
MTHLKRASGLVFGALVFALVARSLLSPDPTALSSTYRQANVEEWANNWPVRLVGASACTDCHADLVSHWQASQHKTVTCEDCHGATKPHVDDKASLVVDRSREFCATCHGRNASRPANFPQVVISEHWGTTSCAACHNPHDPSGYQPSKLPHAVAGYQDCLSCHQAGASAPARTAPRPVPADHRSYANNGCLSCHQVR